MFERKHSELFTESIALYSDCEQYRYLLTRTWEEKGSALAFIMLNPSTATEQSNDPTVERCCKRAMRWGYGRIHILNLFAFRSTNPQALYSHPDPVGPENDQTIRRIVPASTTVICAWGNHGKLQNRSAAICKMLADYPLHYLALSSTGEPIHPLYLSYQLTPQRWNKDCANSG